ncbi:MAG: hypothetical protein MAGBODY4_00087 [Candidatus Marinimicrobia bacterium]|nr:hypothetical protein [Candidatus Neomarinimicrobiota bacterium]
MCHLVLLMPFFGLSLFWALPVNLAMPLYLVLLMLSGVVYYALIRAMKEPVRTGNPALLNQPVQVVKQSGSHWIVERHGELWQARSDEFFVPGQQATVDRVDGMKLHIHS